MNIPRHLVLSSFLFSFSSLAVTIEDVNIAHNAIRTQLYSNKPVTALNEHVLQNHIDTLETATREIDFDESNFAIILHSQLSAAELINNKYRYSGQAMDLSQVQDLLDDLDQFSELTDIDLNNLEYTAGHIAAHQLQNKGLAHRYWSKCGQNGHAGCMNILASGYETGEFVVEKDLDKAVKWHSRVVSTGTRWACAGFFSSLRLAILSSSGVNTNKPTTHWLKSANELRAKRMVEQDNTNACHSDIEYIAHYTMDGHEQKWLDKLATVNIKEDIPTRAGRADWIKIFPNAQNLNVLMPALNEMYDDARRCSAVEEFALKSKGNKAALNSIHNYISTLDPEHCAIYQATIIRLRDLATL
jgi:hypothetical protein